MMDWAKDEEAEKKPDWNNRLSLCAILSMKRIAFILYPHENIIYLG